MEALFVVPTMVSENINTKFVPALCKLIERNLLLTNAAVFRAGLLKKYTFNPFKSAVSENEEYISEGNEKQRTEFATTQDTTGYNNIGNFDNEIADGAREKIANLLNTSAITKDRMSDKKNLSTVDSIELPGNISFFHNIGIEPTYLSIPLSVRSNTLGTFTANVFTRDKSLQVIPHKEAMSDRVATIGMKCIPYKIKDTTNIISFMEDLKSHGLVKSFFFRKWNQIKNNLLLFSDRWMSKRNMDYKTGTPMDIIFSPSSQEMNSSINLMFKMSGQNSTMWSTLVILSVYDFGDKDIVESLNSYKKLVRSGWGDMIVMNEPRESIFFCTTKMGACFDLPLAYLRNILNLSNVIDYSEVSRWTKPFSKISSIGNAVK